MEYPDIHSVVIIGAGPCGLAVAARLREETPSALFTDEEHQRYHWIRRHTGRMNIRNRNKASYSVRTDSGAARSKGTGTGTLVLDSTGTSWMQRWKTAFATLEIAQLRSPMFFHIDPADRDGMLAYTRETGREEDLWEIRGCVGRELSKHRRKKRDHRSGDIDERDRKDYYSPSTSLFDAYCSSIVRRYSLDSPGQILHAEVSDITYSLHPELDEEKELFCITGSTGETFYARSVVLAVGAGTGGAKIFPFPLSEQERKAACHSLEITSFPPAGLRGKISRREETTILVVGGGLSSAQIVDMAIKKGVSRVHLLIRGDLKVKHFDIGLTWMGKFKNFEKAAFWSADSDEERLEMFHTARDGGSINPRYVKILKQYVASGKLVIHTHTAIADHRFCPVTNTWEITTNPPTTPALPPAIDYIYFATGVRSDITALPFLQSMLESYPIPTCGGFPCLTDDLMWREDVPLFVTGRFAALRLGPGGPNLEGARLGAERIAWKMQDIRGDTSDQEADDSFRGYSDCFCGLGNRYAGLA
ncbi:hypothetical protein ASPZODRAFT_409623 [Penicilliopsis zonata CBS 506.65]|uniref:L-ornithine N(5)-monooxygenase n=1 Tax=Penicilliopsis zonata CBS 506.65 TaxID=1073090 RepID=A0A1L9SWH7_9EURO|nr:hypothetical protein ASPZODRAFT_409623 [Penicilliopsis zonata CBS 506.65]OJJ51526.1 hypothetical protein ASPZODRAFT_409623 [Penicilliopsis zonata CBS 506.65]